MSSLERLLIGVLIAIVAAVAIGTTAYMHGTKVTKAKYEAIIAKADQEHADKIIELNGRISMAEHKAGAVMAAIDQHHQEDIEHAKQASAATLAAYRTGNLRLRNDLIAHAVPNPGMPSAAPGPSQCDASCTGGLQPAFVESLISEAARANDAALQLAACQSIVRADRAVREQP